MAVIVLLDMIARRFQLPRAAALILGGIGFALIPGTPDVEIDPELVLVLFLPPLLMSSAWFTSWRDFRADLRIILQLAVGAVFFTTLVVGLVAHLVMPSLPWAACFALGAIVSPPDSVAAKAVLQSVPLPPRIIVLLEGESLVNDASGLVLLRFAIAAALTGSFSATAATVSFFSVAIGGLLVGIVFAFAAILVIKRIKEIDLAIAWTFLVAWISLYRRGKAARLRRAVHRRLRHDPRMEAARVLRRCDAHRRHRSVERRRVRAGIPGVYPDRAVAARRAVSPPGGYDAVVALLPVTGCCHRSSDPARFAWMFPGTYLPRMLDAEAARRDPLRHGRCRSS